MRLTYIVLVSAITLLVGTNAATEYEASKLAVPGHLDLTPSFVASKDAPVKRLLRTGKTEEKEGDDGAEERAFRFPNSQEFSAWAKKLPGAKTISSLLGRAQYKIWLKQKKTPEEIAHMLGLGNAANRNPSHPNYNTWKNYKALYENKVAR